MARMTRRSVLAALLVATARVVATEQRVSMTKIFADEIWYRDRREPERDWEGVLAEREVGTGPHTRTALGHVLRADDRSLLVYTPSLRARLKPFINRRVRVVAKLVDLSAEGFGEELWPGWIRAIDG
jgi:hypothetical protein